jgi:hypothetical protein
MSSCIVTPFLCRTQCQRSFYGFSEGSGEHCHGDRLPNVTICQGLGTRDARAMRFATSLDQSGAGIVPLRPIFIDVPPVRSEIAWR